MNLKSVDSLSRDRVTVTKALHQDIWPDKDSSLCTQMRLYVVTALAHISVNPLSNS